MSFSYENLKWEFCEIPPSSKKIEFVEKKIGIKFPTDFIKCVKKYHAGSPTPNEFKFIASFDKRFFESGLGGLLSFEGESGLLINSYDNLTTYNSLPHKIVPFATNGGGDYMCFDYRETKENPPVVYWEHEAYPPEKAISYLAPTFTDFLKMLK